MKDDPQVAFRGPAWWTRGGACSIQGTRAYAGANRTYEWGGIAAVPPVESNLAREVAARSLATLFRRRASFGFTLVELLVVVGVILAMMALAIPAFNAINGGGDVDAASHDVAGALQTARSYAMANHTYTWIGFFEQDPSLVGTPADDAPAYDGIGQVVVAVVYSKDGTAILQDSDTAQDLPAASIGQIGKAVKIDGVHLADIGAPSGGDPETLDGRPGTAYTYGEPSGDHSNRISSDSPDKTAFPFVAQNFHFYKTIRFSPVGEAEVLVDHGSYRQHQTRRIFEIGLKPARGSTVDVSNPNEAAVQLTGIGGNVTIYRK